jgi:hypothetical protein
MAGHTKLAWLLAALVTIALPSFALAQDLRFSVFPAEIKIDNLPPGETTAFNVTIHNKDEVAHNFTFTTFQPPPDKRRTGRAEFPDDSWISFSPQRIEVPPGSLANVTVTVAVPRAQEWTSQDWEIWLAVASESTHLLAVNLWVRLLVSTGASLAGRFNAALAAGIIAGAVLSAYGVYHYIRRRAKLPRG